MSSLPQVRPAGGQAPPPPTPAAPTLEQSVFRPRLGLRRALGTLFTATCMAMTLVGLLVLAVLLISVTVKGWPWLTTTFLTSFMKVTSPEESGIKAALVGTLWMIGITAAVSVPLGVGAAVYLEEYATQNRLTRFIHLNIANLAGVPSIVYGMLGLAVFIRALSLGRSVLAGSLTMSLLVLPVIIIAAREALLAVPKSIRLAAYALGATRWQVVRHHVLPAALPGIMTGVILSLSRAIGEAAPLIMMGIPAWVNFVPQHPLDQFTVMPMQIYFWSTQPQDVFRSLAAAAIVVLLVVLLSMNAAAVVIRNRHQKDRP